MPMIFASKPSDPDDRRATSEEGSSRSRIDPMNPRRCSFRLVGPGRSGGRGAESAMPGATPGSGGSAVGGISTGMIRPLCRLMVMLHAGAAATAAPVPTRGFAVDTTDRNEVVAFYQAYYMASEGYRDRIGWTGSYNSVPEGAEGTVSAEFTADVERRLNYLRAMCGLKADVRVNTGATVNIVPGDAWEPPAATTKAAASQRAALMIALNYPGNAGMSHDPSSTATGWTPAAWNANRNGNLSLGFFGPGAVEAYFKEEVTGTSDWNVGVGHRRWLMFPLSTDFATGDTPGSFTAATNTLRPPSNVMYVVPKTGELDFSPPVKFAAYPPMGFCPAKLNTPFWSLSYPKADFSAATVSLKDAAMNPVPVTVVSRINGFGDNTIVWRVPAPATAQSVTSDTAWQVTVSNIKGTGVPAQHSYTVTLIDPDQLNETPVISRNPTPLTVGGVYTLPEVPGADRMEAGFFLRQPAAWTEGAEDAPATTVIGRTHPGYALRATTAGYVKSGSKSFRLTFPTRYDPLINGVPQQQFELGRDVVPGPGGQLVFQFRRGLMTPASKLAVEYSPDDGTTWSLLGSLISGLGGAGDTSFQAASMALPGGPAPLRIRFRYYLSDTASPIYAHEDYPTQPTGVFVDNIAVTGCDGLQRTALLAADGLSTFALDATTAGQPVVAGQEWWLRARAVLGGKAFPYGPATVVAPAMPLQLIGPAEPPASGADYEFITDPTADSYLLEVATLGPVDLWTEGAESSPPPRVSSSTGGYALLSSVSGYRKSGTFAFRLGLSTPADEEDHLTLERRVVPSESSSLDFWFRRGPMSLTNRLHAELSTDDGATWTSIGSIAGTKKVDKAVTRQSIPLAPWADRPVKLRLVLRKEAGGSNLKWNAKKSGIWIDDITVTSPSGVVASHIVPVAGGATRVRLDDAAAGGGLVPGSELRLRLRSVHGGAPGSWGPALRVIPVEPASSARVTPAGFAAWQSGHPALPLDFEGDADRDGLADGVEYAFSLDPGDGVRIPDRVALEAGRMTLSRDLPMERSDVIYGAEWSDDLSRWSADGIEVRIGDGEIRASAPQGHGRRFMRWNLGVR